MDKFTNKFVGLGEYLGSSVRFARKFLCLLLFGGFFAGLAVAAEGSHKASAWSGARLGVAVGDFDGDLRPDLADVQTGRGDFFRTEYWIQLQLSTAGRQTILVVAPAGGLQIAARDVNGDHALDLVLTTTWLGQPVAVLLNDGHGIFSLAEPGSFPDAFSESDTGWDSTTYWVTETARVLPQQRVGICLETARLPKIAAQTGTIAASNFDFRLNRSLLSYRGRAPPFKLS